MKALHIHLSVVGMIALLALGVAGCGPKSLQGDSLAHSNSSNTTPTVVTVDGQGERVELQVKDSAPISAATEPSESPVASPQDGSSLLQIHCAKCHSVKLLERTNKPHEEWERILLRMEKTAVHLTDAERSVLLDYLAATAK